MILLILTSIRSFECLWKMLKECSFSNSEQNETHIWTQIGLKISTQLLIFIIQFGSKWWSESSICLPFSFITTQNWRPMLVTVCLLPVCTWLVSITTADEIELNGIFDKWNRIITYVIVFWYWLERNTFQMNCCHCVYSHSMLLLVLSSFLLHFLFSYSRYSLKGNST